MPNGKPMRDMPLACVIPAPAPPSPRRTAPAARGPPRPRDVWEARARESRMLAAFRALAWRFASLPDPFPLFLRGGIKKRSLKKYKEANASERAPGYYAGGLLPPASRCRARVGKIASLLKTLLQATPWPSQDTPGPRRTFPGPPRTTSRQTAGRRRASGPPGDSRAATRAQHGRFRVN